MPDRRAVDDLTIEELEQVLRLRKREARQERLQKFADAGRRRSDVPSPEDAADDGNGFRPEHGPLIDTKTPWRERTLRDKLLLAIEVAAALGLVGILAFAAYTVQQINADSLAEQADNLTALPTASPTPLITVAVLPGGHIITNTGEAQPNYDEVPGYLRPVVEQQFSSPISIPTPGPSLIRRIIIEDINVNATVVQGDGWEQLKQGVAQHIGTANPGQRGNMVLSAHNDIFGEIFRRLDELKPGDRVIAQTLTQEFTYEVQYTQIVKPDKVSVMDPTSEPIVTLISCYPYLVDNQRIVVVAKLVE